VTAEEVATFRRCIAVGGVALFPSDTVYGLATQPESREGVDRLYRLKGRSQDRPAAIMFFRLELALAALPELGERTRAALDRILPGPVTAVLPNPARRFPLACGPEPKRLGLRVPFLEDGLAPLREASWPVLQSSANPTGSPEAASVAAVDGRIRAGVDMILDGGELPGIASTVVSLVEYEDERRFQVLREGALAAAEIAARLEW
jgi:L-threonylcarbamoyladenylate synthase